MNNKSGVVDNENSDHTGSTITSMAWIDFINISCISNLVAKRILPIPFRWHRIMGYVILVIALLHGSIAIGLHFGVFRL
jgi:hypothetical protein